jgi:tetratricopeptide (TPR) repeat protein
LGATRWTGRADAKGDRERALAWAESSFPAGSLMAFDAGLSPPDSSRLVWVGLPFHSLDPGVYRGAYWPGWFGACRGFVLSERIAQRYLDDAASPPEVLSFYEWARASAVEERAFGGPAGRRLRGLATGVGARPALGEGWRDRVRRGAAEGLAGPFLAGLGGGLLRGGHAADGIALLEAAVDAGYTDIGLYLNLANGRLADGDVTEAGRVLEETVRRFPDSAEALYALGRVLVRVGYWQRAIPVLSGLRDRWPRFAPAAYLLGVALANAGQREAAATQLRGALELGLEEPQRSACREALDGLRGGNP